MSDRTYTQFVVEVDVTFRDDNYGGKVHTCVNNK
jgi:hypothetical protein